MSTPEIQRPGAPRPRRDARRQPEAPSSGEAPDVRTGFWLYAGHLLTVWGLAASNILHGLFLLWSIVRAPRLRRTARERLADPRSARDLRAVFVPAALAVALFTLSAFTSLDPSQSLPELRDLISWSTLFLAPLVIRGATEARRIVDLLIGLIVVLAVHGIGQYYLTDYGSLHRRIVGLFSHYQTFAGVLLVGALLLAARLGTVSPEAVSPGTAARADRGRAWTWAGFGLVLWCLLLTLTRGAWVAAMLTLVGFALVRLVGGQGTTRVARGTVARRTVVAAALLVVVLLTTSVVGSVSWGERIGSIVDLRDASNYDRLCMAEAALFMISERPLVGIGPEVVKTRYAIYRHPTAPRLDVPHLHNAFLQRAAELGLPYLGAYLWMLGAVLWVAWRRYRDEGGAEGPQADLYLGAILVTVGFCVAGFFEDNWRDTEIRRLVLFALALPLCPRPLCPRPLCPRPLCPRPLGPRPQDPSPDSSET